MANAMSRSEKKRLDALARWLRPSIAPVRKLLAGGGHFEQPSRLFEKLGLNPKKQIDCQTLAALLAIHLFVDLRGAPAWTTVQQIELLAEVDKRRQKSAVPLNDEHVCQMISRDKKSPSYFRRSPRTVEPKGEGLVKQLRKARRQFAANSLVRVAFPLAFDTGRF